MSVKNGPETLATGNPGTPEGPLPGPSAGVPLVFGGLGLFAALLVPAAACVNVGRTWGMIAYLSAFVLIPFSPLAWWAGRRYEDRCRALGLEPRPSGRTGRWLGLGVTILMALEGSALALLAALARMSSAPS